MRPVNKVLLLQREDPSESASESEVEPILFSFQLPKVLLAAMRQLAYNHNTDVAKLIRGALYMLVEAEADEINRWKGKTRPLPKEQELCKAILDQTNA